MSAARSKPLPLRQFAIVANRRPFVHDAIGLVVGGGLAVAAIGTTSVIRRMNLPQAALLLSILGVVLSLTIHATRRAWKKLQRRASLLGTIELDDVAIRWRLSRGAIRDEVAWRDVRRAVVDRPKKAIFLRRIKGPPFLLFVASADGRPLDRLVVDDFDDLVAMVGSRTPTPLHEGREDRASGRKVVVLGAVGCLLALALHVANLVLGHLFDWTALPPHAPLFVGLISLHSLASGIRIVSGFGSVVSPIDEPSYLPTRIRFLVGTSIVNFVLVVIVNTIPH